MGATASNTLCDAYSTICCDTNPSNPNELDTEQKQLISTRKCINNWSQNKNAKIVIIGAGPAGVHMASLLLKKGYKNVIILEKNSEYTVDKNDRWNEKGKAVTIRDDELNCVHEMGTCYLHPRYDEIKNLVKEYDPNNTIIPYGNEELEIVIESHGTHSIADKLNVNTDNNKQIALNRYLWNDWVEAEVEKVAIPQILHWIPDTVSNLPLLAAAQKYIRLHKQIFGDYNDQYYYEDDSVQFPPKPANMEDINMTFLEWINKHNLQALIPNFLYAQSVQGYGILDDLPALYGLWWNSKSLMEHGIDFGRLLRNEATVFVLKKGFYSIFNEIVNAHKININYDCKIMKINRNLNNDKAIEIIYKHKQQNAVKMECDVLFIAVDLSTFLSTLDRTDEEYAVFNTLNAYTLVGTLFENDVEFEGYHRSKMKRTRGVTIYPEILLQREGGLYASRNSSLIINKENYYKMYAEKGLTKERSVGYQFMNTSPLKFTDDDKERYKNLLLRDLNKFGKKNAKVLYQNVTRYFPKWDQTAINKGYPWKVKYEMQGKYKNTYYIGSSVCFESVESVIEYNLEMVERLKL